MRFTKALMSSDFAVLVVVVRPGFFADMHKENEKLQHHANSHEIARLKLPFKWRDILWYLAYNNGEQLKNLDGRKTTSEMNIRKLVSNVCVCVSCVFMQLMQLLDTNGIIYCVLPGAKLQLSCCTHIFSGIEAFKESHYTNSFLTYTQVKRSVKS